MPFELEKWYFDCVSEDGDAVIGYAARLAWGPIRLGYGAVLHKPTVGPLAQSQRLTAGEIVTDAEGAVRWRDRALGIDGSWRGSARVPKTMLVDGPEGRIEWECLCADADVALTLAGREVRGTGYVERLTLTILPWRLPFRELRWGRYISHDRREWLVWIDMRGRLTRTWAWSGESGVPDVTVGDDGVHTSDHVLRLGTRLPIRHDDVGRSLLGRYRFLALLLPRATRLIDEHKYVSPAVMRSRVGVESRGFAIHEDVVWL